ncbi:uncharacterized protein N7459_007624 [Penicillium hispanicum]|uniref:uncharacterized protein n=1 Tax=Penicillium hispanicum TaxID=1080232 RepID=UPI0025401907|nr:uncharacterized protein N7459_007624 [Penicillium hispanicum]KAJ5578660.1 hypothetical protein N7459_007624 [Penicillium hispanicum]
MYVGVHGMWDEDLGARRAVLSQNGLRFMFCTVAKALMIASEGMHRTTWKPWPDVDPDSGTQWQDALAPKPIFAYSGVHPLPSTASPIRGTERPRGRQVCGMSLPLQRWCPEFHPTRHSNPLSGPGLWALRKRGNGR